ncbi:MAG: DedA family protein, partial [Burkholderiaceae bacterium]
PFVAGVSEMTFKRFQFFNISGAFLWVVGLVAGGYFFGNLVIDIPLIHVTIRVKDQLNIIVLLGVGAAVIPLAIGGLWKFYRKVTGK